MAGKSEIKQSLRGVLNPLVALLSSIGVTPLGITTTGIALSMIGSFFVAYGRFFVGGVFLLASGLCDVLDGSLARRDGRVSTFGAFIDSTGDRVTELFYFGALIFYFARRTPPNLFLIVFTLIALGGAYLTSYTRARSEGLGIPCSVGWLERPERLALLILGLLLGMKVLAVVIVVLAILGVITAAQRINHVDRMSRVGGAADSEETGTDSEAVDSKSEE
ncbi:MAG: hypothetical protein B6D63_01545 [Candidatus Latescibacteria bacterium 4484_7]|nr:MAG: hypothetical protein B6D63_01545 [Candidatus Latescibacteria bacterium 4484_7]